MKRRDFVKASVGVGMVAAAVAGERERVEPEPPRPEIVPTPAFPAIFLSSLEAKECRR